MQRFERIRIFEIVKSNSSIKNPAHIWQADLKSMQKIL